MSLIESALSAGALAIENTHLQAELQAHVAEVAASRQRIVEAGLAERKAMERDLHDGAQQRLLGVKLTLGAAEAASKNTPVLDLISRAKEDIGSALEELRGLARGLHPPLLSQSGIKAAVVELAESHQADVSVDLPNGRFSSAVGGPPTTSFLKRLPTQADMLTQPEYWSPASAERTACG